MSPEDTPPEAGGATLYRQDAFERRPTRWTRPLQASVAIYFVVSSLLNLALTFVLQADIERISEASIRQARTSSTLTAQQVHDFAALGMTVAIIAGVVGLVIFAVLAWLTRARPRTWVFWVDLVLLGIGAISLVSGITGLTTSGPTRLPLATTVFSLLSGGVSAALACWMVAALVRHGPWAQEKVPLAL
jgi:hypothetical protein